MVLTMAEAVKLMLKRSGNSIASVSRSLGYGTPAAIANMLTRGSLRLTMATKIANVCGYKLVMVPAKAEVDDAIEITEET